MRIFLLLGICLLLGACEKPAPVPVDGAAETTVVATAQPTVPDTSTWPSIINAGMEYPYRQLPALCVGTGREDRNRLGFLEPETKAGHLFRTYYIKPEATEASQQLDRQLRLLARRGLLRTRSITVDGVQQIGYLSTNLGWALNPTQGNQSLCFSTGESHVSHITDYTAVPDEQSGLEAYHVEYELGPLYLDWFDAEAHAAFPDYRHPSPTLLKALLVKGPKAYYFATASVPERFPRPNPPGLQQARSILLEGGIIDRICQSGACDETDPGKLKILHVAAGNRGSATLINFSYDLGAKGNLLASIRLERNAEGQWDTSRASYRGSVQPAEEKNPQGTTREL
jgi:hypothetical protein